MATPPPQEPLRPGRCKLTAKRAAVEDSGPPSSDAMEEAIGYFYEALQALEALPDTQDNRRRRLRLVFDQTGEFHFLHRHQEYYDLIVRHRSLVLEVDDIELLGAFYARLGHRQWDVEPIRRVDRDPRESRGAL